jgi:hypothetical protein
MSEEVFLLPNKGHDRLQKGKKGHDAESTTIDLSQPPPRKSLQVHHRESTTYISIHPSISDEQCQAQSGSGTAQSIAARRRLHLHVVATRASASIITNPSIAIGQCLASRAAISR